MAPSDQWPRLLRLRPRTILGVVAAFAALVWLLVLFIDILNVAGLGDRVIEAGERDKPLWWHMFNSRPVEWSQWFILAGTVVSAGYLAGRLSGTEQRGAAIFFLLFAIGVSFMLIEEAGDIRHNLHWYVADLVEEGPAGTHPVLVSDLPYFMLLAAIPVYAVLRYGRDVWRAPSLRRYLVAAYTLYALAAGASATRFLGNSYVRLGRFVDERLLGGRWPRGALEDWQAHFELVDSFLEETVELVAAGCLFAVVVAFASDLRDGRVRVPSELSRTDRS